MSPALADLVRPSVTAVVTMECQRGVCGDLAAFPELRTAAEAAGVLSKGPELVRAARAAGVRVVHATAEIRADGAGSTVNCRLLGAAQAQPSEQLGIVQGAVGADLIADFGPDPVDIVTPRLHGVTPFTATSLDQILRNLGVQTVIAIGVSLNVGVLGLVLSAVDLGYNVVVPTDGVAGVPLDYGATLLEGTISLLATLSTVDEVVTAWRT